MQAYLANGDLAGMCPITESGVRLVNNGRCHSGVNTARKTANHAAGAHLSADSSNLSLNDVLAVPVRRKPSTLVQEVLQ